MMKKWFSNKDVGLFFDDIPQVGIRYYIPTMPAEEKKSIEKYSKNLNNMENNLEHQKSEFDNLEESIRLLLINSILNEIPNE